MNSYLSIIHPSRGRPKQSAETIKKWIESSGKVEVLVSVDEDDRLLDDYVANHFGFLGYNVKILLNKNRSAVDAINNAAAVATGDVFMVVSDDTDCLDGWYVNLLRETKDKTDFILKTQDGIQPYIITMPVMDRAYYNRTGYIYDPDFKHMFCDTWLTVQADISGRKITSQLKFLHLNDSIKDEVRVRSDATWQEGERMFIEKVRSLPHEDLKKIQDASMRNWIRNKTGIRI